MKKIIIIGLALLLWGCGNTAANHAGGLSAIYLNRGEHHNLSVKVFYPLRFAAVNEAEIEKVVLVKGNEDKAVEVTITNQTEIDKIAAYFKSVNLGEETAPIEAGNWIDVEITLKEKAPLYFRFSQYGVCTSTCLKADKFEELEALAADIKGNEKEVAGMPIYSDFMQIISWADVMPILPKPQYTNPGYEEDIIYDNQIRTDNLAYQVLEIANYISEDFNDITDIHDVDTLTAGLIKQSDKYICFEEKVGVCRNRINGDILYFPDEDRSEYQGMPYAYAIIHYNSVKNRGIQLFGDGYTLPDLNKDYMVSQSMQTYTHLPDKDLFLYNIPYEVMFPEMNAIGLLDQRVEGDLSIYTIAKIKTFYYRGIDMPYPQLEGKNGYIYRHNYEDSIIALIKQLQDHFETWEYVLRKEEDGYRLVSGRCLNRSDPSIPQVDMTKEAYYFDEQGLLKVNLASKDAALFNEWVVNQKDLGNSYKANINRGLLSIWISDNYNDAVVFDIETGKTLTTDEVIHYLNINTDKLESSIKAIPEYKEMIVNYNESKIGEFKTSRVFINSKGKPAYDFNYFGIILFEWEEVQ